MSSWLALVVWPFKTTQCFEDTNLTEERLQLLSKVVKTMVSRVSSKHEFNVIRIILPTLAQTQSSRSSNQPCSLDDLLVCAESSSLKVEPRIILKTRTVVRRSGKHPLRVLASVDLIDVVEKNVAVDKSRNIHINGSSNGIVHVSLILSCENKKTGSYFEMILDNKNNRIVIIKNTHPQNDFDNGLSQIKKTNTDDCANVAWEVDMENGDMKSFRKVDETIIMGKLKEKHCISGEPKSKRVRYSTSTTQVRALICIDKEDGTQVDTTEGSDLDMRLKTIEESFKLIPFGNKPHAFWYMKGAEFDCQRLPEGCFTSGNLGDNIILIFHHWNLPDMSTAFENMMEHFPDSKIRVAEMATAIGDISDAGTNVEFSFLVTTTPSSIFEDTLSVSHKKFHLSSDHMMNSLFECRRCSVESCINDVIIVNAEDDFAFLSEEAKNLRILISSKHNLDERTFVVRQNDVVNDEIKNDEETKKKLEEEQEEHVEDEKEGMLKEENVDNDEENYEQTKKKLEEEEDENVENEMDESLKEEKVDNEEEIKSNEQPKKKLEKEEEELDEEEEEEGEGEGIDEEEEEGEYNEDDDDDFQLTDDE